jgi:N-acetylglutamate synthase-like GNAT family acetyltransferase
MSEEIQIRRAKREDLAGIASLVQEASQSKVQVDEAGVMEWLFSKGLWVAIQEEDSVVGVAACQTENLVSVTDSFYLSAPPQLEEAGIRLLEAIEAEVNTLMCEVNVVVLPAWIQEDVRTVLRDQGYEAKTFDELHRIWREVLSEFVAGDMDLMVKRLRERMVMVPI